MTTTTAAAGINLTQLLLQLPVLDFLTHRVGRPKFASRTKDERDFESDQKEEVVVHLVGTSCNYCNF